MPLIKSEDQPVCIVVDPQPASLMPYVIVDVNGNRRCRFADQEDANAFIAEANKTEQPKRGSEGAQARKKSVTKKKGRTMPRGIPKKKKATKKRSAKSAVKKTVQKTMKRRKKRAT